MIKIEDSVVSYIDSNFSALSKRAKRFLAMYFPNAMVRRRCWIETSVLLGDHTFLNPNVTVVDNYLEEEILLEIGANCSIAPGVVFAPYSSHNNSKHLRASGLLDKYESKAKITIGDDVWIGANCTIGPGVTIGSCCIIGANSYVCKDIPAGSLSYGTPAKVIKQIV